MENNIARGHSIIVVADHKFSNPGTVLIITNVADKVFTNTVVKKAFEHEFQNKDPGATFYYQSDLKRVKVEMTTLKTAITAKVKLTNLEICDQRIDCFFLQQPDLASSNLLEVPVVTQQLVISPPVSPNPGWEPDYERKPEVDYDILAALTNLGPGETYTLVDAQDDMPSIQVQVSDTPSGYGSSPIKQTARPHFETSKSNSNLS